jgi:hypothetical protein
MHVLVKHALAQDDTPKGPDNIFFLFVVDTCSTCQKTLSVIGLYSCQGRVKSLPHKGVCKAQQVPFRQVGCLQDLDYHHPTWGVQDVVRTLLHYWEDHLLRQDVGPVMCMHKVKCRAWDVHAHGEACTSFAIYTGN